MSVKEPILEAARLPHEGGGMPEIIGRRVKHFVESLEPVQLFEHSRGKAFPSTSCVGQQLVEVARSGIAIVPSSSEGIGDPRQTHAERVRLDRLRQAREPSHGRGEQLFARIRLASGLPFDLRLESELMRVGRVRRVSAPPRKIVQIVGRSAYEFAVN
jgi:hypothetical protein